MITIIDYDMGNVGSIKNMIIYLGFNDVEISSNHERILSSTHIILPGVGSFDDGISNLEKFGLIDILKFYVMILKKPILGICLGMQLFGTDSEEGNKKGLSFLDVSFEKFKPSNSIKIPHMGWNKIKITKPSNSILKDFNDDFRFYFVHSYHAIVRDSELTILTTLYGNDIIVGLNLNNIYGVQFHPEKSHKYGMVLLKNFLELEYV